MTVPDVVVLSLYPFHVKPDPVMENCEVPSEVTVVVPLIGAALEFPNMTFI